MAQKTRTQLKATFVTGARPAQQDYHDLLDSYVHKDEQGNISESTINAAIAAYDATLRAEVPNGTVNTLGDVFKVLAGYSDSRTIASELSWAGLPSKPTFVPVIWDEQKIIMDSNAFPTNAVPRSVRSLTNIPPSSRAVIVDLDLLLHRATTNHGNNVAVYSVVAVTFGVQPKAALNQTI